jgi:hypothetical protein
VPPQTGERANSCCGSPQQTGIPSRRIARPVLKCRARGTPHVDIQPFPRGRCSHSCLSVLHPGDCRPKEKERPCDFLAELFSRLDRSGLGRHPDMGADAGSSPGASNRQSVISGFGSLHGLRKVFTSEGKILSNVRRSDYGMTRFLAWVWQVAPHLWYIEAESRPSERPRFTTLSRLCVRQFDPIRSNLLLPP